MKIAYYFDDYSDEPFYYEVESLYDFLEDTFSYDELIDIYIEEVYKKDAKERESVFDEFGWRTTDETKDALYEDDTNDWIIESIVDYAENYIESEFSYELKQYFQEDAVEEYVDMLEADSEIDEIRSYSQRLR